jgi:AraC-like DNA-binding protein
MLNGTGMYTHGGKKYKLSSGDLILAEPNTVHEISSFDTKDLYLVFLMFTIQEANIPLTSKNEDIILSNFVKSHKVIIHDASPLFHYLPMLLVNNNGKSSKLSKIITTKAWFFDCISRLSNNDIDSNTNEKNNKNIDLAVSYIMKNIRTNIRVNDVAKNAYVSERHLRYLFQKYYSMSVTEFIQKRKVLLAETKLRMGFKVNEAAEYVGIYNASQFTKLFKKVNGFTPRAYNDFFKQLK